MSFNINDKVTGSDSWFREREYGIIVDFDDSETYASRNGAVTAVYKNVTIQDPATGELYVGNTSNITKL